MMDVILLTSNFLYSNSLDNIEKIVNEVSVMRFLTDQTTIPVPFILHSGTKQESPLALSPFIPMEYIEHETKMNDPLNTPGLPREQRGVLDPDIAEDKLRRLYAQMADVLLQLSLPALPRTAPHHSSTGERPLPSLPGWSTWELTYAAPVQFSHAPPWWLLIERPEEWAGGVEEWTRVFEARPRTFLQVMQEGEGQKIQRGRLHEGQRLSGAMRRSWEGGDFWVLYALRNSFAFDLVYWLKIDERFWGLVDEG
ncbi:hypothetical protein ASPACDRAFT_1851400 [Aspergillus aculeatus ATCC 16872]|uniref:Uncharacterized protein n=1 Tax=Aspergillus aculeatus (strain ATCC 16872 / CBS 172.66 / WB 5094) TaxID=690307 RepID=A0A1L9X7I9_ASPA1|nr:uncharacterized protein ASPACDRAFT_1851400 [Aspergillus aculeatus ATCC 16872]OJK04413.1 hypothetical protein ASPACDRAFT_1851400 [Aspergillus aculeatus ATCC 16872]